MKVIYIAGPFRGPDAWIIHNNVFRAEYVANKIASMGAMPLCPHSIGAHFNGTHTAQFWIDGTLELMRRCDAVLVLEGWVNSEGTRGEIAEAYRLGLPVFKPGDGLVDEVNYALRALEEWLAQC